VTRAEAQVLRKRFADLLEQAFRVDRRAEIPHVTGEHDVERIQLVRTEARRDLGLLRAPHAAPHVGVEGVPEGPRVAGEVEYDSDLSQGDGHVQGERPSTSQLQELRPGLPRELPRARGERLHRGVASERTAVADERRRDEEPAEEKASDLDEREHARQLAPLVRGEVYAAVTVRALVHVLPAEPVEVCPSGLPPHELVPRGGFPCELGDDRRLRHERGISSRGAECSQSGGHSTAGRVT